MRHEIVRRGRVSRRVVLVDTSVENVTFHHVRDRRLILVANASMHTTRFKLMIFQEMLE